MFLPDVNVWLALAFPLHKHHISARKWFESQNEDLKFCRVTQSSFLRLANNPRVFQGTALTQQQAWETYNHFLRHPQIGFMEEPE